MAKKKKKSAKKRVSKKKAKKVVTRQIDLGALMDELDDAQRELRRIRTRLDSLRTLCRRIRVSKV